VIEIIGDEGTTEYEAAVSIGEAIKQMWRGVETSLPSTDNIRIAANVKISGYKVSDIDVVVFGNLHRPRNFIPVRVLRDDRGAQVAQRPVAVANFVIAVEVKDHDETRVHISGNRIDVKYLRGGSSGWKSATDQNVAQVHALKAYLEDLGISAFVFGSVFMRGLSGLRMPGAISSGFDGPGLFTAVAGVHPLRNTARGYELRSVAGPSGRQVGEAPIFRTLIPSALDRKKMDAIVNHTPECDEIVAGLGSTMVHLRGRGGTGKTILMLQAARRAFESGGKRSLVLTYNHALAADIRRLLALLRVPADVEQGGISVETVMGFMCGWFKKLGVSQEEEEFSGEQYESNCKSALELISEGVLRQDDIDGIVSAEPDRYDFDCVFVDEAQDWPKDEGDLLKALYGAERICLADGIDQLIRGQRTDWSTGVQPGSYQVIALDRCLRMKRNLAAFANMVGQLSDVNWHVVPNDLAGGGRVIILRRPYFEYLGLHGDLLAAAKKNGNSELDFLICVPANSVSDEDGKRKSDFGENLLQAGYKVWDGVDRLTRRDFPRSLEQFRVVQYASCRGLEGWTVILQGADQYWRTQRSWCQEELLNPTKSEAYESIEVAASRAAWYRLLIALTRPIDTLVIALEDYECACSKVFLEAANQLQEFVEVLD